MTTIISPDVLTQEIDLTGVATSINSSTAATVGQFNWGAAFELLTITSEDDLLKMGKPSDATARSWFTVFNFLQYANPVFTVRAISSSALNSSVDGSGLLVENSDKLVQTIGTAQGDTAIIVGRYAGALGDSLQVKIVDESTFSLLPQADQDLFESAPDSSDYVTNAGGSGDEIHVIVYDAGGLFTGVPNSVLESYEALSKASDAKNLNGDNNYYIDVINTRSQYINVLAAPAIASYAVEGEITNITVDTAGAGYESLPTVDITGAGTSATADAVLSATGEVKSVAVTGGGTGYTVGDAIVINGDGTGATAEVGAETGGVIDSITVTDGGTGYTTATVDASATGNGDATGTVVIGFTIDSITVTAGGSDYVGASTVVALTGGSETTAATFTTTATAINGNIDAWGTTALNRNFQSLSAVFDNTLSGGSNGTTPTSADVIKGWELMENRETVDAGLFMLGDACGDANLETVAQYVVGIVEARKDAVLFKSPKYSDVVGVDNSTAVDNAIATRNAINANSSYVHMDSGYKQQFDKHNNKQQFIPLNGDVAGLYSLNDRVNDPWFSAAGVDKGQIRNASRVFPNPQLALRDKLHKSQINAVVSFTGRGTVLFNDLTQLVKNSYFKRMNVRRLLIVLRGSIEVVAQSVLFKQDDEFTRTIFEAQITPFLRDVKGRRGISDFKVTTLPPDGTGSFTANIFIKPVLAIKGVTIRFVATPENIEFSEIVGV